MCLIHESKDALVALLTAGLVKDDSVVYVKDADDNVLTCTVAEALDLDGQEDDSLVEVA